MPEVTRSLHALLRVQQRHPGRSARCNSPPRQGGFPKPSATRTTGSCFGKEDRGQPKLWCSFLPFSLSGVRCEACLVLRTGSKALPVAAVLPNLPWELRLSPERPSGSGQAEGAEANSTVRAPASAWGWGGGQSRCQKPAIFLHQLQFLHSRGHTAGWDLWICSFKPCWDSDLALKQERVGPGHLSGLLCLDRFCSR